MHPPPEPLLANILGYSTGSLLFAIFLFLLLKDRAGRRLQSSVITICAAALALLWNFGSLLLLVFDSYPLTVATTAAMSLLPALLLHLILGDRRSFVLWAGYLLSAAAILLHISEPWLSGQELHLRTLQATAAGFALLATALFFPSAHRRSTPGHAGAALALFLFALSFAHLHSEGTAHAWGFELIVHHAGVPLALFVLMQDFRFLLLDAFLRFLANFLLAALFTWAAAEAAYRFGLVDYHRLTTPQIALMAAGSTSLLVAFAIARTVAQNLLTRLLFRRSNDDLLLRDLRKHPIHSEAGYLEWAGTRVASFFEAEQTPLSTPPHRPLPFDLGRRAGGRPYLSEDLALLARLQSTVDERLEHYREAELKRLITQAELRALESRIHPHFLFNALNVLYGSIPKAASDARRTVLNLSDIFRYFLQSGRSTIPLESEIQIVRAYLEIETLRLGEKLQTHIAVTPEANSVSIPVLSIQPLVENAIKHGIATLPEGGRVNVSAHTQDGLLTVTVQDSGPGFSPQPGPGLHVGLDNVRQRLRLCYGDSAKLDIRRADGLTSVGFTIRASGHEDPDR